MCVHEMLYTYNVLQVIEMRKTFKSNVRFMLMNSFSTSEDTLEFLQKYPDLANDPNLELVQVSILLRVALYLYCCIIIVTSKASK